MRLSVCVSVCVGERMREGENKAGAEIILDLPFAKHKRQVCVCVCVCNIVKTIFGASETQLSPEGVAASSIYNRDLFLQKNVGQNEK